jgi:mono/diheme cytochrome c family protein
MSKGVIRHGVAALCLAGFAQFQPDSAAAGDAPGASLYAQHCLFCHGVDRQGIDGSGVDLTNSALVRSRSADELAAFLSAGRTPDDPASRTGRAMPSFDWVSSAELRALAEYLKTTP